MKVFLTLACALAAAQGGVVLPKIHEEGASVQYRSEDGLGNYQFGYDEKHTTGGSFRKEKGDGLGRKVGSYGLHDADGRVRVVNYVADEHGFRAAVQSNEPGVAPEDPAATSINKAPVAIPYSAPMHLDHVTGINVGLAQSVAAPVLGAYSAPVAQISAPVIAPVGYHRQPMHFTSVLGPSVSNLIGAMPAHIGAYIASQAAHHPLQKAIAYNAPIAAAAPVAAAYAPVAAPALPAAPVVYKAPAHFGAVVGPSVDHMLNHYVPQHIAAQKFYRSLNSQAVHYQEAPVVSSTLEVAPAAPVASAVVAPVAAAPVASYAAAPAVSYGAAPIASYAPGPIASYAAAPVAPVAKYAAPVASYAAAPVAAYATGVPVAKYAAAAPIAAYATGTPVARYAAPYAAYATGVPVAKYAAAAPVASYAPSVSYASAPAYGGAAYGVSAAPVSPVIEKSLAYSAAPAYVQSQYAGAAYAAPVLSKQVAYASAAPVIEKQVAYGPAAVGYGPAAVGYGSAQVAYAAAPAVAKIQDFAGYAPAERYIGSYEVPSEVGYGYGAAAGPAYARVSSAYAAAPVTKLASVPTYSTPVYAAPPAARSIYSYGPLSVESSIAKPAVFAAPAFDEPAVLAGPVAAPAVSPIAAHVASPIAASGHLVGASLASTGVSSVTANVNGYTHELVKPNAYTRVYQYMYGHSPSFYGYSYSPVPLGYKKK